MSKITIKNISTGIVSLYTPELHVARELVPGRVLPLTDDEYQSLSYDPGFVSLVQSHYIKINGVEEDSATTVSEPVYEATEISKMLDSLDVTAFAKFIPNATSAEKESAVQFAVDKGITNNAIVALIKKYCGVDIISAINAKHQAEEE